MNKRCVRSLVLMCVAAIVFGLAGPSWPGRGMRELQVARTDTGLRSMVSAQMTGGTAGTSLYVDGVAGNDANDGSPAKPFKSVQRGLTAAAAQNRLGRPVTVYIKPTIYREAVAFPVQKYTAAPITLISTVPGGTVIDGSDLYTGWTQSSGAIYAHPWTSLPPCECPYDPQNCPHGIGIRREMVFVNGQLLRQVASRAAMRAGTYTVDDRARRLYVWTPTGASPDSVTTTVSTRGSLFSATTGVQNLTLNGLVVRGSSDCAAVDAAIDIQNVANVVLQDVSAVWNNNEGIFILGAKGTFQFTRVHADNNGFIGMGIHNTKNLRAADSTTNGNNWRGEWVNFGGWFTAGVKFGGLHDATITRWTSNDPFWLDTDATRVTVNDLHLGSIAGNNQSGGGLILEVVQGPVTFNGLQICQATPSAAGGTAIVAQAASNITINNAILFLNYPSAGSLFGINIGSVDPQPVKDWETGVTTNVTSKNWKFMHGAIVIHGPGQNGDFVHATDAIKPDYWSTLVANYNVYWDPIAHQVWGNGTTFANFATYKTWRQAGQEGNSVWANPFQNDPTGTCTFVGARGVWPR